MCLKDKPETDYHKDKSKQNGLSIRCKDCKKDSNSKYRTNNVKKIKENDKIYRSDPIIREKAKEKAKKWYVENKERAIQTRRAHYINNKEQYNINRQRWYEKNPDFKKEYSRFYMQFRKDNDPEFSLKMNISLRIRQALKLNSNKDKKKIEILCGCSIDYFKKWIEYQFETGFTWKNHGSVWHFDHVIPMSSFDLTNEIEMKKCFHWSNLQPLEKTLNLKKSSKIIESVINKQRSKALLFEIKTMVLNCK